MSRYSPVIAGTLLILVTVLIIIGPTHGEICHTNEYTSQKYCTTYHIALVVLWHIGEFFNYYGVVITAFATLAIGWFTYSLRDATNRLWKASEKQLFTVQRPWVSARIEITGPLQFSEGGFQVPVNITMKNTGPSPAFVNAPNVRLTELKVLKVDDAIRRDFFGPRSAIRYTLFNQDTITVSANGQAKVADGAHEPQFDLLVTVLYQTTFNDDFHRTAYLYILRRGNESIPSGISGFALQEGGVAADQLNLVLLSSHAD